MVWIYPPRMQSWHSWRFINLYGSPCKNRNPGGDCCLYLPASNFWTLMLCFFISYHHVRWRLYRFFLEKKNKQHFPPLQNLEMWHLQGDGGNEMWRKEENLQVWLRYIEMLRLAFSWEKCCEWIPKPSKIKGIRENEVLFFENVSQILMFWVSILRKCISSCHPWKPLGFSVGFTLIF